MINSSILIQPPKDLAETNEIKELNIAFQGGNIKIITPDGHQINIPYSLLPLFKKMIETLGNGDGLTVIPIHKELTTQQAAEILNVSRPFLIKLLETGEIAFVKVGKHRRISMQDLIEYKNKREKMREENLDELARLSQETGLYD
jgi:excisionase family DNA binding protein